MIARLATTSQVNAFLEEGTSKGLESILDKHAGTALIKDGDEVAFRALKKGATDAWIVVFKDTAHVTWAPPRS